jgi:glycerate kinase
MFKKIVVASDSFKGSLTSLEVADSVEKAVREAFPQCDVVKVNVADGGEGTMDALRQTLGGTRVNLTVSGPLGRPVEAYYVILDDGITAVLEMSAASGLPLLAPEERNPSKTSTYGTGELIRDALGKGCTKFLVGIGGSATNDAGRVVAHVAACFQQGRGTGDCSGLYRSTHGVSGQGAPAGLCKAVEYADGHGRL